MSTPTPDQWHRIEALFDEALSRPPEERAAYLDAACPDAALRAQVERLLAADAQAGTFLNAPAHAVASPLLADLGKQHAASEAAPIVGRRLGAYRLVAMLGQGGMGTVYLAERADGQFEHRVALKLVRPGPDSGETYRRFAAERQILARLQHPGIARLLDGGVTEPTPDAPHGQPYFVMDHVAGQPITAYCDAHRLGVEARLRLFLQVCEAVQYAHRNLVVHRDLKPSNILVTDAGRVKLLDFGIAKLLGSDAPDHAADAPLLTRTGHLLMTPEYAAPEQVRGEAVTTSTDVYALGVLLYELLTGRRPYQFEQYTPTEIERVICEQEPTKPSTAVLQTAPPTDDTLPPLPLGRQLRGDLDTIVLMALRKEPERRYGSVEQLAEDLRRYLGGLPVLARDASVGYRARKFFQRHRLGVTAATLVAAALVAGLTVALWQAQVAAAERDRARLEAAKAQQVALFLRDLFKVSDPTEALGDTITAREILERGAANIQQELVNQPEIQAMLLNEIGWVYRNLGAFQRADSLMQQALVLRRRLFDIDHADIAESLYSLGVIHDDQSNYEEAERYLREALAMRQQLFGDEHPDVAQSLNHLGVTCYEQGKYDEAERYLREALAMRQQLFGDEHPDVAQSLDLLGQMFTDTGAYEEAQMLLERALVLRRSLLSEHHPDLAVTLYNLALLYWDKGDYDAAEPLLEESAMIDERVYGPDHPNTALNLNNLGLLMRSKGDLERAKALFQQAIAIQRNAFGPTHRDVSASLYNLAVMMMDEGDYQGARPPLQEALAIDQQLYGPAHPNVGIDLSKMGLIYYHTGQLDQADDALQQALAIFQNHLEDRHHRIGDVLVSQGFLAIARRQYDRADSLLQAGIAILGETLDPTTRQMAEAQGMRGVLLTRQARYAEAEPLLLASYETVLGKRGSGHAFSRQIRTALATVYTARGDSARAARYR